MTTNILTWMPSEKQALLSKGYDWLVVVRYTRNAADHMGDVVSRHRSYNAAARAAGPSQFLEIRETADCIAYDDDGMAS